MFFNIDSQTVKDLQVFDAGKGHLSIYNFFYHMKSLGGKQKLHDILFKPMADLTEIKMRQDAIHFFSKIDFFGELDIDKNTLDFIEHYLMKGDYPTRPLSKIRTLEKALINKLNPDNNYYIVERGIDYIVSLLSH